jgi:hypothetical protein
MNTSRSSWKKRLDCEPGFYCATADTGFQGRLEIEINYPFYAGPS